MDKTPKRNLADAVRGNLPASVVRAVIYARTSSDQQSEASPADQRRECHALAAKMGFKVVAEYEDVAMTGTNDRRPGFQAMLADAKLGKFEAILVFDLARFTRDLVHQETAIRALERADIRIMSVSGGYDSKAGGSKITRIFAGLQNEMFIEQLAANVHRGQKGQALKGRWNGGRPYGYRIKSILDKNCHGEDERLGVMLEIRPDQAAIVKEIFERFANGESYVAIASDLNRRGVPSAGSTWKRVTRRCKGWMGSSVRAILVNPLYCGRQRWNVSRIAKNPETGKDMRRLRPEREWIVRQIESLRIVSDELFALAKARIQKLAEPDVRLRQGGRRLYMLTGLLKCAVCGRNYEIADRYSYGCSSHKNGGNAICTNNVRVSRTSIEGTILGPVLEALRDKDRVARMAKEMQAKYAKAMAARTSKAAAVPAELRAVDERLAKLRTMPDLTDDERQMLIDKAQAKRRELVAQQPDAKQQAKILTMLPKAATLYLQQLEDGLQGNPREAAKGRAILRDLLGPISLAPGDYGSLWATYEQNLWAVAKRAVGGPWGTVVGVTGFEPATPTSRT